MADEQTTKLIRNKIEILGLVGFLAHWYTRL